jgi:hypothetical protein
MRQCLRAGGVVLCVAVLVLALVTVGRPAPMPVSTTGTVLPHTDASGSSGNYFKQEIDNLNKPGGLDVGGEKYRTILAFPGSSDHIQTVNLPAVGDAKVNCYLAKSVNLRVNILLRGYMVTTKFDDDKITYPFVAVGVIEYLSRGTPGTVEIKLTRPDGQAILASSRGREEHFGVWTIIDPDVVHAYFWYQFKFDGKPVGTYRFDFFADQVHICGGALNGQAWTRDEAP